MSDSMTTFTDAELSSAISDAMASQAEANRLRDASVAALVALQKEQAARKAARKAEIYVETRRIAASKGLQPPSPPKGFVEPCVRAASARLAVLPIVTTRSPESSSPAGEARPVVVEDPLATGPLIRGVSDHAVVRYLERVLGVDMAAIRSRIMTPLVESAIRSGVRRIRTADGVVVATDGIVTSFLPNENGPNRRRTGHIDRGKGRRRRPESTHGSDVDWSASVD